ncbi:hypothetical protein HYT18_04900 [Candidatus Microgenomates bacterium]|nr:hypothetical protein [Candidatus Microgenomates bacterium]MBI4097813.1 hypothetical protein [Candidatus Levybacteria bacterium]
MSDSNPPPAELGLTAKDMGLKPAEASPSKVALAKANGRFYNSLLDIYLSKDSGENRNQRVAQLVEGLPQHARGLYDKGLQTFQGELAANHGLLQEHRGEEAKYLVGCVMKSEGRTQEQMDEVFSHITPDQARFIEPAEGVVLIQVEHELYDYLTRANVINGGSEAIHFGSDTKAEPSFVIVRRHRLVKGLNEDGISAADNSSARHEFHHFIWNFLERENFVREPQEASPELSKAFGNFRNELAAYIIEGRALTEIDPYAMTYTPDRDIQELADDTKAFAYVCMEIARSRGVELSSFLYPAMTSRSFAELRTNMLELTPVGQQVQIETVNAIYDMWGKKGAVLDSIQAVLKGKNATITPDTMRELATSRLASPKFYGEFPSLRDLQYITDNLAQFSTTVGKEVLSANDLLKQTLNGRLPFSDETIADILNMPREIRESIPVVNDPEKFIRSFVSMWQMDDDARRSAYAQLINATPEMRVTFERIRDEIIAKDESGIKTEYGYERADEERKRQIESDIQKKAGLIRSL